MSRSSAVVSYVQGLLLPGVLTLKGYYPKVSYVQGLFTSRGTLLRSLALILKDISYVQGLLLPVCMYVNLYLSTGNHQLSLS